MSTSLVTTSHTAIDRMHELKLILAKRLIHPDPFCGVFYPRFDRHVLKEFENFVFTTEFGYFEYDFLNKIKEKILDDGENLFGNLYVVIFAIYIVFRLFTIPNCNYTFTGWATCDQSWPVSIVDKFLP